uniref:CUB domain-containing protein n=1 Tax=Panagrellus redivivus TaxID=6233 RepID=A0A7E4VTC2_PANRE
MQSPYYPQNYNDNDTITREILVPDSFGILFTVWDFVGRAGYDYLAILSGSNVHLNLTGQQTAMPFKLRVPNNQATLVWSTNATKPARGFNLTYVADPNLG